MWGIHRSSVNSPHKGQWRGALMFSLICLWINDWVNNREAGDLRCYHAHYDVTVMLVKQQIVYPFMARDIISPLFLFNLTSVWQEVCDLNCTEIEYWVLHSFRLFFIPFTFFFDTIPCFISSTYGRNIGRQHCFTVDEFPQMHQKTTVFNQANDVVYLFIIIHQFT